jgi:hypothetical protein
VLSGYDDFPIIAIYVAPDGSRESGIGILEHLATGAHPTGLSGIVDPYIADDGVQHESSSQR